MFPAIESIINNRSIRAILESKDLAQLGDLLVNFIYSSVKIGIKGKSGSTHVWDSSLRDAMDISKMRSKIGKRATPGKVADAAEAFIAYSYFNKIMSLDDMIQFISERVNVEDFTSVTSEKMACASSFAELLVRLGEILQREGKVKFHR